MASSAAMDPSGSPPLTDYEKQRLENVKRNQAMIAALGIQNAMTDMQGLAHKRGYKRSADNRAWGKEQRIMTRRLRSSTLSLTSREIQNDENPPPVIEPAMEHTSVMENTRMPLSLRSVCIQGSSTESLVSRLQELDDNLPLSLPSKMKNGLGSETIEPREFSLQGSDIARVVPTRIMSVAFLPVSDRLVVAAGDKAGHLGIWDVDCDDSDGDVVHVYQPHSLPVSGMSVASSTASKIFTCSYDGTIKQLDVVSSMFDLMYCSEEDDILSAVCSVPGMPHCVWTGEGPGSLKMLDTREKSPSSHAKVHQRTINTIDLNLQSPWLMVTSSTDMKACLWDVRKLKTDHDRLRYIQHQRAVHSAQFSPYGNNIATCSYDNTVAILKGKAQFPRFIAHPNMNNRWISTFRAIWGWDEEYVYVGNMKRTIDVISSKFEIECHWLSSPLMTTIPCRLAAHPLKQGVLAGCSAGGQVFIWRQ